MKWILPLAALLWLVLVGAHLSQVEPAGRAIAAQKPETVAPVSLQ